MRRAAFAEVSESSSAVAEDGQIFTTPESITTSCPVGDVEVIAVAVNERQVPEAASVIADALVRALEVT